MGTLSNLPGLIAGIQPMELALALITLAILWFTPASVKRFCPPQLLALGAGNGSVDDPVPRRRPQDHPSVQR